MSNKTLQLNAITHNCIHAYLPIRTCLFNLLFTHLTPTFTDPHTHIHVHTFARRYLYIYACLSTLTQFIGAKAVDIIGVLVSIFFGFPTPDKPSYFLPMNPVYQFTLLQFPSISLIPPASCSLCPSASTLGTPTTDIVVSRRACLVRQVESFRLRELL